MTAVAPAPSPRARERVASALPFVPAFVVVAVWIAWAPDSGGYFPIDRYPGALLAAGLLLTLAIARPPGALVTSRALLPLGLFAAWTVWNGISVVWSGARDAGFEGTNELLAVTLMGAVMAFTPWRMRSLLPLLVLWAGAIAVIAGVDLVSFVASSDPGSRLLESRYLGPVGYSNGSAALGAMAFWPLLAVAAGGPRFPAVARVAALPAAMLVLAWALLPQSRGTMLAGLAVIPLFLAMSSHRVRVLTRMAVVGGGLLICVPALFDVYTASREKRGIDDVVETAVTRVGIAVVVALVASLVLVTIERRLRPGASTVRWTRRVGVALTVLLVVGAAGVGIARQEQIRSGLSDRWDTFSSFADVVNTDTGARIGQVLPDKRYDYWKVAYAAFRDAPVLGGGAGDFEVRYAADKLYPKHSRYVHDIWLRALSETGIVGGVLLLAALLAGFVALVSARVRCAVVAHPAIAAVTTLSVAFFLQCSLDWLEEVPALLAPAVALPLAVLRATSSGRRGVPWAIPRRGRRGGRARDGAAVPVRPEHRARRRPAPHRPAGGTRRLRPRGGLEPAGGRAAPQPRLHRARPARRRARAPQLRGGARRTRGLGRGVRARAARLAGGPARGRPAAAHPRGGAQPQRPDRHRRACGGEGRPASGTARGQPPGADAAGACRAVIVGHVVHHYG